MKLGVQVAEAGSALHRKTGKLLDSWLLVVFHLSLPACCEFFSRDL